MSDHSLATNRYAFLIGVADYDHISSLRTPLTDIRAIGALLCDQFGFEVEQIENASCEQLKTFFGVELPARLANAPADSQVLLYFAGHGYAQESEKGISGYLIPRDGCAGQTDSWYPMDELRLIADSLPVRHVLLILDCCFGGAFRFASRHRSIGLDTERQLFRQHYQYYTDHPSRQVLTSTAPDQTALDFIDHSAGREHSPFAYCLMQGLSRGADLLPDQIITGAELYNYLQQQLPVITGERGHVQNAGMFPLDRHLNGEFLFPMPGFRPEHLTERQYENPYKGLEAYQPGDAALFFGRKQAIGSLLAHLKDHSLTVVSGASGSGKSSLVLAGVVPRLQEAGKRVAVISPGRSPLAALPDPNSYDVLVVDQAEQLITQAPEEEAPPFLAELFRQLEQGKIILLTVRIDFEAQLPVPQAHKHRWSAGRFLAPPFSAEELREIIITPALRVGRFIEPPRLVDRIIDEVIHYPGSLPLLSFTMQQLFELCKDNPYRNINEDDYRELGGVNGALQSSADRTLNSLDEVEHRTLRHLMLRMVSLSGGETAGRRVLREELRFVDESENARVEKIVKLLEAERLIRGGEDSDGRRYLEPCHDALVRSWKTMQDWIKAFRADHILLLGRVTEAVSLYRLREEKRSYLWHDNPDLPAVWSAHRDAATPLVLNAAEEAFIRRSRRVRRRNSLRLRGTVVLVMAILSLLTLYAFHQQQEATQKQEAAERSARANLMAALALQKVKANEYTLGWHLAVAAWETSRDTTTGASTESGVCAILSDIISDTTAWIGRPLEGHAEGVNEVVLSPDGNLILTAGKDSIARLWDNRGQLITSFKGHTDEIKSVDFSPNGQLVLTCSYDGTVRLWNINGLCVDTLKSGSDYIESVAYSPDGQYILIASEYVVQLWDTNKKMFIPLEGHTERISSVRFSPSGQYILTTDASALNAEDGPVATARLWNREGKFIASLDGHSRWITSATFSRDEQRILTSSLDHEVRLWNLSGKCIHLFQGITDEINSAVFSPDGQFILTAGEDQTPRLWDKNGQFIRTLERHDGEIFSAVFSPDNQFILTASLDGKARIFDRNGYLIQTLEIHPDGCKSAFFSHDGQLILTKNDNDDVQLWSKNSSNIQTFEVLSTPIYSVAVSPDDQSILVLGFNRKAAQLLDKDGKLLYSFPGHKEVVISAVFSPDGQSILTASFDGTARLWDTCGQPLDTLAGHEGAVYSAVFSPDGESILTTGDDGTFRIWEKNGKPLRRIEGNQGALNSAVFSPDGEFIFTVSQKGSGQLWNRYGVPIQSFDNLEDRNAVFSPDGQSVLTYGSEKGARLWNKDGRLNLTLDGHTDRISSASFSRNGAYILTSSWDKTTRIWDRNGKILQILRDKDKLFYSAVFSPDDQFIITGNGSGEVQRWWSFPAYLEHYRSLRPIDLIRARGDVADSSILTDGSYTELLEIAEVRTTQGDWESAFAFYDKASGLYPSSKALLGLYSAAEKLNKPFDIHQLLKSTNLRELTTYGDYFFSQAKWKEAKLLYEKAEEQRHQSETLLRLYDIAMETNEPFNFQRLLGSDKGYDLSQYGEYFFEKRKWKEARQLFQKAEIQGHRPKNLLRLYEIASKTGESFDFQRLLGSDEKYDLIEYGEYFFERGKWEEARQLFQKAEEQEHQPENVIRLYDIAMATGEEFDFLCLSGNEEVDDLIDYAVHLFRKGKREEARQLRQKAEERELQPEHLLRLYDIATEMDENFDLGRLFQSNDPEELELFAKHMEEKAYSMDESDIYLALALRLREKQLLLTPRLSLRKEMASTYRVLGETQLFLPNAKAAEASFGRGIELDPECIKCQAWLAPALLLQNRWREAEKVFLTWKDHPALNDRFLTSRTMYLLLMEEMEDEGITHPDFPRARALLLRKD